MTSPLSAEYHLSGIGVRVHSLRLESWRRSSRGREGGPTLRPSRTASAIPLGSKTFEGEGSERGWEWKSEGAMGSGLSATDNKCGSD